MKRIFLHPVWLVFLLSLLVAGAGFWLAWLETGTFCYALDDSFIMMALSENLAFQGVWGLTRYEFSSTASSPLFAVLLAAVDLFAGDNIWNPLVINIVSLLFLYWLSDYFSQQWGLSYWQRVLMLTGLFLFMPVPVLLFGSMEHILHTLVALGCLWLAVEIKSTSAFWIFLLMGMLLASIRYEGLFEGGFLILWLWKEKKWLPGLLLGIGMLIPVCWLGFYSLAQGWFFLPNSLVLKAYGMNMQETGSVAGFLLSLLSKAANYPHCMVAMLAVWLVRETPSGKIGTNPVWTGIVLLSSAAHFFLARYGHVYRYEAYLMALAWLVVFRVISTYYNSHNFSGFKELVLKNRSMAAFSLILALSPVYRSAESFANGSKAIVNIYEQQVQTAWFVRSYYNHAKVGALDIGAIAWYSDCRLVDLWGLGNLDFASLKLQNRYRPHEIDSVCRKLGIEMVVGYGNPIREPGWERAESWVIRDNRVCARDTIDFYALNSAALNRLEKNLSAFRRSLPAGVLVIRNPKP